MKRFTVFIVKLIRATHSNNLITHANELTYKLMLAFFPFIIFLMSLLGFFNINADYFLQDITNGLPDEIMNMVNVFISEVIDVKNAGVLSTSLVMAVFTSSSGFNAVIKGINKAYGMKETRNFFVVRLVSVALVFTLAIAIIGSILILIFGDAIYKALLKNYALTNVFEFIFGLAGYLISMIVLLFTIIFIYKFATCKKVSVYEAFPGAFITLVVWVLSSKLFNIYINNFARYSRVYGSIAGIVILMFWLNIISIVLLIGGEINALISEREKKETSG